MSLYPKKGCSTERFAFSVPLSQRSSRGHTPKLAKASRYSTVQGFFHQPAHPRGEGATIKRISPPRKPQLGGIAADPRRFRGGFYR